MTLVVIPGLGALDQLIAEFLSFCLERSDPTLLVALFKGDHTFINIRLSPPE